MTLLRTACRTAPLLLFRTEAGLPQAASKCVQSLNRFATQRCSNGLISVKSALKPEQAAELAALADTIAADIAEKDELRKQKEEAEAVENAPALPCGIDNNAMFKLSYGLYVLTARSGKKDNGCIINTAVQLTDSPKTLTIAVNKANFTEQMIRESGEFNLSVLTDAVPMSVISRFGFQSGRDCSKFEGCDCARRSANGIRYIPKYTNAYISCKVLEARDHGTHTLFVAEVTEAVVLDKSAESVTYERYLSEIKPKTAPVCSMVQKGYVWQNLRLCIRRRNPSRRFCLPALQARSSGF